MKASELSCGTGVPSGIGACESSAPAYSGISRRRFLQGSAGLSFALALGAAPSGGSAKEGAGIGAGISAWVRIDAAGVVTIYNPVAEMGQGSSTALPLIVAEEMDADWDKVAIAYSPIEPDIYGHDAIHGRMMMLTVGSFSVEAYFDRLRIAGAQVRHVLLVNAAEQLGVALASLSTTPGAVLHPASGRRLGYGEIAQHAKVPQALPEAQELRLKPVGEFRLIGKSILRRDLRGKVDGSAEFAIDVDLPGMQFGMIQRAPVAGSSPLAFNREVIAALPDISAVIPLDHGVGIVGKNLPAVMKARQQLQVEWSKDAPAEKFDSDTAFEHYASEAAKGDAPVKRVDSKGDIAAADASAAAIYRADYLNDFVYHAQMEPLNAVAALSGDVPRAELWIGSQFPSGLRAEVATLLGIDIAKVTIHARYLGGGFGRRSWHDFGLEAVQLAQQAKVPVKLVWSREDDIRNGMFRPMSLQRMEAGVDADGNITGWRHRVVGDNASIVATGAKIPFYAIPNQAIDLLEMRSGMKTKHWRSVGYAPNKFAIESFIDEIATARKEDPYQLRRKLLRDSPRALKVLDEAVDMSPYGKETAPGRALGLAFSEHQKSLTAGVVEISLVEDTARIRVHRVWLAVDAGIIVQPDNAIAQMEGAIIQGISSALLETVSVKSGAVHQSNFGDYEILRMADTPEIAIRMIASEAPPTGIGEIGLPFTGPAIANAFAALTGKRLRHMPFNSSNIKLAMLDDGGAV